MRAQRLIARLRIRRGEAEAVHAAIHLEVDVDRPRQRAEELDLARVVDDRCERIFVEERHVGGGEDAFQHQDRLRHARAAQALGFGEVEHGEAVGGTQRARRALQAVTIGVRLDHCPDARAAGVRARDAQVVRKSARRDGGADRAWHFSYCAINARSPRIELASAMKGT